MEFDDVKRQFEGRLGHSVKAGLWEEMCALSRPTLGKVRSGELSLGELERLYSLKLEFRERDEPTRKARARSPKKSVIAPDNRLLA
ncbi:MAG TPA: hypothetical protein VFE45_13500, partial [Coriobacteriia bacterium]|nr:hypothetical protein [Coriobacteriia bacterium]